ncbi:LPXTG cell wall anchor domain-containing protein [Blautia hydrogenotrophica]|uniref:LPXTG cell wall anchor domain-containing protein n=1 Tax=Blautia hydrogenotrophica TaxID=53443 RepID=UPI002E766B37|nr:LPXTG cell wall anchor domain-containing protein [Blautia hydrogenotrophica]MEE0461302.1 LPXTG cell wall anchor domain-containing protein [Blautia hydrogenotrophica]
MRKARLYALTLAAIMAVSGAPVYGAAEETPNESIQESNAKEDETESEPEDEDTPSFEQDREENGVNSSADTVGQSTIKEDSETEEDEQTQEPTVPSTENPEDTDTPAEETKKEYTVKTEAELKNALTEAETVSQKEITIFVEQKITLAENTEIKVPEGKSLTIARKSGYTGILLEVKGTCSLKGGVVIDGAAANTKNAKESASVKVLSGGTLTIENAILKGNNNTEGNGGAIENEGTVQMSGGSISGNTAAAGAAIYNKGTLVLAGGSIENNKAAKGAVYVDTAAKETKVAGNVKISGNTKDGKTACNLSLAEGKSFVVAGNLTKDNAKIGVTYNGELGEGITVYTKADDKIKIDAGTIVPDDNKSYVIEDGIFKPAVPSKPSEPENPEKPIENYDATKEKSKNVIQGLVDSYKKGAKATFTVVGAGLDREPKTGDTAYVPIKWAVKQGNKSFGSGTLSVNSEGECKCTINMNGAVGDYTLVAYYELREWSDDTTSWEEAVAATSANAVDREATATKEFKIIATSVTKKSTPISKKKSSAASSSTKKSKNAKTADETPILPLAGLCAASVLAGGLVVTRRRKRENE